MKKESKEYEIAVCEQCKQPLGKGKVVRVEQMTDENNNKEYKNYKSYKMNEIKLMI